MHHSGLQGENEKEGEGGEGEAYRLKLVDGETEFEPPLDELRWGRTDPLPLTILNHEDSGITVREMSQPILLGERKKEGKISMAAGAKEIRENRRHQGKETRLRTRREDED